MLIDLRQLAGDERFEADVCVVGAGAAGISLARELAARGRSVLLVESGGFEYEQSTQALYGGDETGTLLEEGAQYLASTRLRYFGGTTNHWNGWCRPLDDEDLDSRPWVAEVDWPLSRDDLMPFYHRACPVVQISPFDYEDESAGMAPKLFDGDDEVFATTYFHLSPPTRFSALYRAELETSERIRVLLHANLRRLDVDPASGHVRGAEAARLDGTLFPLTARHYVLAAGAIENARLLLAASDAHPEGLGNDRDLVGRHFMDHPFLQIGYAVLPYWRNLMGRNYERSYVRSRGNSIHGALRVHPEVQRREELLNAVVVFQPLTGAQNRPLAADIASFVKNQHVLRGEKEPRPGSTYFGWVLVHGEQSPNPDSRVTLADDRDALGMRRSRLDWRLRDRDRRSLLRTADLLAHRLGAHNHGRMRILASSEDLWSRARWSFHHMGTTRMHPDPARGVVDADCRLHGVDNLFVAGSSVFPTVGVSNPTLTIVALALRLADHLAARPD
jgi:choline dehydrogenase-like flavoprotein